MTAMTAPNAALETTETAAPAPERRRTLWDIGADLQALDQHLQDTGGDLGDEETEARLTAWMSALEADQQDKLDAYGRLIRMQESRAAVADAEARIATEEVERCRARKKSAEADAKRLKDRLLDHLDRTGQKRLLGHTFRFTATATGKPKLELAVAAEQLPPRYRMDEITVVVYDADRTPAIQAAINGALAFLPDGVAEQHYGKAIADTAALQDAIAGAAAEHTALQAEWEALQDTTRAWTEEESSAAADRLLEIEAALHDVRWTLALGRILPQPRYLKIS